MAARRRKRRRILLVVFGMLVIILMGATLYGLQQPGARISHIEVFGADASIGGIAAEAMQGSYLGIIPRDSIAFFPSSGIRARIMAAGTDIATVSIFRTGLSSIKINIVNRVPIARWCGAPGTVPVASSTPNSENCYVFDDSGYVFATSTNVDLVNSFTFYEPLASTSEPMHSTLPNAEKLPSIFNFARQLSSLGSPVLSVAIRDGEVDNYLASGTRLTYVLGHEQDAYTALLSALPNMNIKDGSLQYVDLRFDGKVYLKKRDATVPE